MPELTIVDVRRILRECAGEDDAVDLDGDIADTTFDDLGYDSLALLEMATVIERELSVTLDDDAVTDARTPRMFLTLVNRRLAEAA